MPIATKLVSKPTTAKLGHVTTDARSVIAGRVGSSAVMTSAHQRREKSTTTLEDASRSMGLEPGPVVTVTLAIAVSKESRARRLFARTKNILEQNKWDYAMPHTRDEVVPPGGGGDASVLIVAG
ncbi:hypothetical protein E4U55_005153 [Claviceps digitariae]|nr:hypothetical protein E4U55_005153 [Claviceps digitariae]